MEMKDALRSVVDRRDLNQGEMHAVMRSIMAGDVNAAQIAGFLIALRMKEETAAEIAGAALAMREFSLQVPIKSHLALVDTCGTGGDGAHSFNISTAAAFVVAAAGGRV